VDSPPLTMAFSDLNLNLPGVSTAGLKDLFGWQGFTRPAPAMKDVAPRADQEPLGASGRAHYSGFIQFDELNAKLVGNLGLRVFDNMYRTDPHIRRAILACWSPIQGASWEVEPYGGDEATDADRYAADLVKWALWVNMKPNFLGHLATLGPVLLRSGFCPFEQLWMTTEFRGKKVVVPRKLDLRLPRTIWRRFQDEYGELSAIEQLLPNSAVVEIPASELLYYRLASEGDNWEGTSLIRQAFKPWFFKEHFEKIDAIGQERKAVGVPVVYPPVGVTKVLKEEVETVLANLHVNQAGYILMPGPKAAANVDAEQGWTVEIVKFDSSSGETVQKSIEQQQMAISASVLADFLELGHHQVGARATAEVQDDPFLTAVGALGDVVKEQPNELAERIARLNVPNIEGPPTLKVALHDDASLSEIATYVKELIAAEALEPDPALEDYLRQRADLPPADPKIRVEKEESKKAARALAAQGIDPKAPQLRMIGPGKAAGGEGGAGGNDPKDEGQGGHEASPAREAKNGPPKGKQLLDTADGDPPTAPWYERLLSQGRLKDALDTCREQMQDAATPAARHAAQGIVASVVMGTKPDLTPPEALVSALQSELERLYGVGYGTVQEEIAKQHRVLGTKPTHMLADEPIPPGRGPLGAAGARLARARERAKLAAQNIINEVAARVNRAAINAISGAGKLSDIANEAADGQLRVEALTNASASINEGRGDAAIANMPDVVGGIYTSVLDEKTCDPCAATDSGEVQSPDELEVLGPPNPNCDGGDRCRCMIVWVLTEDPRAQEALSEGIA
jgi:hypothetical protein